jgi:hypothetical protein
MCGRPPDGRNVQPTGHSSQEPSAPFEGCLLIRAVNGDVYGRGRRRRHRGQGAHELRLGPTSGVCSCWQAETVQSYDRGATRHPPLVLTDGSFRSSSQ